MNKMSLRELLNEVDFDYEIENDEIKLIDLQGVYLGDIAEFRVSIKRDIPLIVDIIIDRLTHYFEDYDVGYFREYLASEYGVNTDNLDWKVLYAKGKQILGKDVDRHTILKYLLNTDLVFIEELVDK